MRLESNRSNTRMPSAVRVRRHRNSSFLDFLEGRRRSREQDQAPTQTSTATGTQPSTDESNRTAVPKRPTLGILNADGKTVSGRRSSSAVEQLALDDRGRGYGDATSGASQSTMGGGRATDGHAPALAMVSEDASPSSHPQHAAIQYPDTIGEESKQGDEAVTGEGAGGDYFVRNAPTEGGVVDGQRAPDSGPESSSSSPVQSRGPTTPSASGAAPNASYGGGQTRFLSPPSVDRSGASPSSNNQTASMDAVLNPPSRGGRLRRLRSNLSIPTPVLEESRTREDDEEYDDVNHTDDVADYLDVVDPEVGALGYLSNIGNSIFFPNIPALYDRRPTHNLPTSRRRGNSVSSALNARRSSIGSSRSRRSHGSDGRMEEGRAPTPTSDLGGGVKPTRTVSRSVLTRVTSAVGWGKKEDDEEFTKHIKKWREMDEEERDELDEHVRMLLTKKSKFKRGLKGFYAFVKTPMGFIMTLYGFLVTFWGTAIVLFIFGWIHVGARKRYWIEICDQILCALFAAVGLGFAPFRAVDTYRMIHIAHYHHLTWKRRQELGLTELQDPNDLPRPEDDGSNQVSRADDPIEANEKGEDAPRKYVTHSKHSLLSHNPSDTSKKHRASGHKFHKKVVLPSDVKVLAEEADPTGRTGDLSKGRINGNAPPLKRNESIQSELVKEKEDVVVLTKGEQAVLQHHQRKFHASHTFYRYHQTATHNAFPLDLMIVIVCLLDCHSLLQAALGGCTWGIKYTHRPTALTATLISCSLSCNAVAGLIIWLGGRRTKKREEVERRLKIALEQEALAKIERRRARGELPMREGHGSTSSDEDAADTKKEADQAEQQASDEKRNELARQLGLSESSEESSKASSKLDPPIKIRGTAGAL